MAPRAAEPTKPNVVIILADDLGYGDLGCFNKDSKIPTPHLDGLAKEGMRFTDAHSPSAVCSPTRYGLLTGRYPFRSVLKKGVVLPWGTPIIEEGRLTLPQMLKNLGYRTACIGKWHLGWNWATKDGMAAASIVAGSAPIATATGMSRPRSCHRRWWAAPPRCASQRMIARSRPRICMR